MRVAGDLKVNHIHVSVNNMNQLPHVEGLFFVSSANLALDQGRSELGREFARDSSMGNPLPLPLFAALPATPRQTHDAELGGQ